MLDRAADEESGNYEVLWIGTDFHRVLNPATVITPFAPFATVPAGMLGQLARDRMADK